MTQQIVEEISYSIKVFDTKNISQIRCAFKELLYVPMDKLKKKVIFHLLNYLQKKFNEEDYKIKVFITKKGKKITGIVVCQIDTEYKSYGRKCGTFGWLNALDFTSCRILIENCERYIKEHHIRKIRGPINFPKIIGGIGFQTEGFKHKMMSGVAYNHPDLKELNYLKRLGYKIESKYTCVYVTQDKWKKGDRYLRDIEIKYLTISEMRDRKEEMMEMAQHTFHTILADASGGEKRLEEFFHLYEMVPPSHYKLPKDFNPQDYTDNPIFIKSMKSCDLEKVVTWAPFAFDSKTGEIVGFIWSLPNLYQIWQNLPLIDANVDTVMIRKEYAGRGIFSALNNIGRIITGLNGITYVEGTTIWSNNDKAIKTIFPHSKPIRKHIVLQKRIRN